MLIKLVLPEENTDQARTLWKSWMDDDVRVFAPTLIEYEFVSAVWQQLRRRHISEIEANEVLTELQALPLLTPERRTLHHEALQIAANLNVPSAYDAHYLALAAALDCEFWTADRRLHTALSDHFPLIRLLGA